MQKEQVTYWDTLANLSSLSQAKVLNKLLDEAEAVVIGIGAGISAAAQKKVWSKMLIFINKKHVMNFFKNKRK